MKVITIGRETDNDVVVDDAHASRHHLQIIYHNDGHYSLSDFGSLNGTFVNGQKISGEITLKPSDIVRIGNTAIPWRIYFEQELELQPQPTTPRPTADTESQHYTPMNSTSALTTLKVIRGKKIAGLAISFSVFVDGRKIGDLKNGVTLTCKLGKGAHELTISSLEKDIRQEINIREECTAVEVKVSIKMGFLAGRPHIDNVKYL